MRIPERGAGRTQVIEALERFKQNDVPWRDGRTWAYVYDPGPEAERVIKEAYGLFLSENGLDPTAFPSALRRGPERARERVVVQVRDPDSARARAADSAAAPTGPATA